MAAADLIPGNSWDEFCEDIEPHLKVLDVLPGNVKAELFAATGTFLDNRSLDEKACTVGHLRQELLDLASLSAPRLELRLAALTGFELAAFFSEMPGAAIKLSIKSGDGRNGKRHARLLPEKRSLFGAAFKTLTRLGDNDAAPTGLVYRRHADTIADHVLASASIEDLSRLVAGLAGLIVEGAEPDERKERRIGWIANRLLLAGSLGSGAIYSALVIRFREFVLAEKAAFVAEIALPCLEDAEVAGGAASALAKLILEEFLKYAPASERRSILILLARTSPDAFAEFAQLLADRLKAQYRLEAKPQDGEENAKWSGRLDARRWYEAHAGWKLIDDVLDVIWPTERYEPDRKQRVAITAIVQHIIVFADEGFAGKTKTPGKAGGGDGRRLIRAAGDNEQAVTTANRTANSEHVKKLIALRSGIQKLDIVLGILDRRALFELEPKSRSCPQAAQELGELWPTIDALQLWRCQLEDKREFGDYERVNFSEPRATGARIQIPRMPQVKSRTLAGDEAAIAKIITAAQPLLARKP